MARQELGHHRALLSIGEKGVPRPLGEPVGQTGQEGALHASNVVGHGSTSELPSQDSMWQLTGVLGCRLIGYVASWLVCCRSIGMLQVDWLCCRVIGPGVGLMLLPGSDGWLWCGVNLRLQKLYFKIKIVKIAQQQCNLYHVWDKDNFWKN